MRCSRCYDSAIMTQRCSGINLCERHFVENVEERVRGTIARCRMLEDNDRIAIALSGGKDSTAILHILNKIISDRKDISLFAITVDEGIKGYREETIISAQKTAGELGIEHFIISFHEEYGVDLDDIVEGEREAPCTFCGVFRKSILNRKAKELGATKVATGHDLDDEAQTVMMNYMKGDIERLGRFSPRRPQPGLVPRIKPLKDIPERETALYAMVKGFYMRMPECPYARLSLRSDVRDMMNDLEKKFPGIKQSTMKGFDGISERLTKSYPPIMLSSCKRCSEPCVGDLCKACQLLDRIKTE